MEETKLHVKSLTRVNIPSIHLENNIPDSKENTSTVEPSTSESKTKPVQNKKKSTGNKKRRIFFYSGILSVLIIALLLVLIQTTFLLNTDKAWAFNIVTKIREFEKSIVQQEIYTCKPENETKDKETSSKVTVADTATKIDPDDVITRYVLNENYVAIFFILLFIFILTESVNKKYKIFKKPAGVLKRISGNVSNKAKSLPIQITAYRISVFLAVSIFLILFIIISVRNLNHHNYYNFVSFAGYCLFILFLVLKSKHKKKINVATITWGISLQFLFGYVFFESNSFIQNIGDRITKMIDYTKVASGIVFQEYNHHYMAFVVLPVIISFSCLFSVLTYLNVIQYVSGKFSKLMKISMQISGNEAIVAVSNIFLGNIESPMIINDKIGRMTKSQINLVMTCGFATIAGGVMIIYVSFGINAAHLITASVISVPAAILVSKILYPDIEEEQDNESYDKPADHVSMLFCNSEPINIFDAIAVGADSGIKVVLNIAAMLIGFITMLEVLKALFGWATQRVFGYAIDIEAVFTYIFYPICIMMGINIYDSFLTSRLLGIKMFLNEFIAYNKLSCLSKNPTVELSGRSYVIMTYALCGFANFGAMGIFIGTLSALHPKKRKLFSGLAFQAMIGGNIACFMTACVAGFIYYE